MKIAVAGIRNYEIRKRLSGKSIKDFHVLYFKAIDFERVQKEELEMKKVKNRNWFNKDPDAEVGCVGYEWIDEEDAALSVDAAEILNMRDFFQQKLYAGRRSTNNKWISIFHLLSRSRSGVRK